MLDHLQYLTKFLHN